MYNLEQDYSEKLELLVGEFWYLEDSFTRNLVTILQFRWLYRLLSIEKDILFQKKKSSSVKLSSFEIYSIHINVCIIWPTSISLKVSHCILELRVMYKRLEKKKKEDEVET